MQSFVSLAVSLLCLELGSRDELAAAATQISSAYYPVLDVDPTYSSVKFDNLNNLSISVTEDKNDGPPGTRPWEPMQRYRYYIMHDWLDNGQDEWMKILTDAILNPKTNSVLRITADYLHSWRYIEAVKAKNALSDRISKLVLADIKRGYSNPSRTSLIGHGLGAHIMGIAAKKISKGLGRKIARIYATSPIGPFFHLLKEEERLHKADANAVIAIHTDQMFLGYKFPIGAIDVIVNGGLSQPGCRFGHLPCSHYRAVELLAESLHFTTAEINQYPNSNTNGRKKCLQILHGGTRGVTGIFNLTTNSRAPYL